MLDPRIQIPGTTLGVSRLCLGGNRFGGELGEAESFALLDAFVEAGGNFIDTAHVYADWVTGNAPASSERMIGRWLASRKPEGIVVATKGGHPPLASPGTGRLDAASLREDVESSLRHLGLPALDLFYLHRDDPVLSVFEILEVLEAMRSEGLLRHYGASNWDSARLQASAEIAQACGWEGFVANQAEWSLATRNPRMRATSLQAMDSRMKSFHRKTGLAAIPYSAQAKGYFDKLDAGLDDATARLYDNPRSRAMADRLAKFARRETATSTQVMLAALMRAPFATIPVIGCRSPEQVFSSFASLQVNLTPAEASALLDLPADPQRGA